MWRRISLTSTELPFSPEELERLRVGLELMALRALGDRDVAEDVAQESLARALAALQASRPVESGDLGAFVRGIARHVIVDTLRRWGRRAHLERVQGPSLGSPPTPLAQLLRSEDRQRVREALGELCQRDAEILRLSFFDGLTPAEIAARSGEPSGRIRKRKSRALARLRRAFLGRPSAVTNARPGRPSHGPSDLHREAQADRTAQSGGDVACSRKAPSQ